jgi:hypothetical protein
LIHALVYLSLGNQGNDIVHFKEQLSILYLNVLQKGFNFVQFLNSLAHIRQFRISNFILLSHFYIISNQVIVNSLLISKEIAHLLKLFDHVLHLHGVRSNLLFQLLNFLATRFLIVLNGKRHLLHVLFYVFSHCLELLALMFKTFSVGLL